MSSLFMSCDLAAEMLVTYDIAHASKRLLETEIQNRYFSRYLMSSEAHAISGCYGQV